MASLTQPGRSGAWTPRFHAADADHPEPWMIAGSIIGGVVGLVTAMTITNTFTHNFAILAVLSLAGAAVSSAVFGGLGWLIDSWRQPSADR